MLEFLSAAFIPFLYLTFVITEHYDVWDGPRGLDAVKRVASQMDTSYDPNVQRQFRATDPGFQETLDLIRKYTTASLQPGREPIAIVRYVAVASGKTDLGNGKFAEWTAPTTPLILLYTEPPVATSNDFIVVGSIGDLHTWIERSKTDFRFFVQDVFLTLFSLVLGVLIWLRGKSD